MDENSLQYTTDDGIQIILWWYLARRAMTQEIKYPHFPYKLIAFIRGNELRIGLFANSSLAEEFAMHLQAVRHNLNNYLNVDSMTEQPSVEPVARE